MATTEVILKENIPGLGAEADVVKVRNGYANNFLVPQGKAYHVTPANLRHLNALKAKRAEREARDLNEAEALSRKIGKLKLAFELETGQRGKAFGSVTTHDISRKLAESLGGVEIDHHKIVLERPIKSSGTLEVPVKLHPDVTASLKVVVKAAGAAETAESEEKAEGKPTGAEK